MAISLTDLSGLIEPHLFDSLGADSFTVEEYPAEELLTFNRLDVAIKVMFLEGRKLGYRKPHSLYHEHIRIFTLGSFREPGNLSKSSPQRYVEVFEELESDFQKFGFRRDLSLIPLGQSGTILNVPAAWRWERSASTPP